jgi:rod shape-determining protein MreB
MGLLDMFTQEIAIDLGTANTLIIHNNKIVVDQPSIVAIERSSGNRLLLENRQNICRGKLTRISKQSAR